MPFRDGTGPMGLGPMTGRGAGFCAGFVKPGSTAPIFNDPYPYGYGYSIPPSPRWGYGFRRGLGSGFGRGFGRGWRRWGIYGYLGW